MAGLRVSPVMKRLFTRVVSWNQPQPHPLPPPPLPPLHWGGAADRCRSASDNRTDIMWKYRTMSPFFSADASRWLTAVRPESALRLESDWIHARTHTHIQPTRRGGAVSFKRAAWLWCLVRRYAIHSDSSLPSGL